MSKLMTNSIFLALCLVVFAVGSKASAQTYPNRPVRIVTTVVGSSGDFTSRTVSQGITASLGQPIVVENKSGQIPAIVGVATATPDGYTLLVTGVAFVLLPFLQSVPYDPVKDFVPITMTETSPNILLVHPSLPVKSVKELIALAKSRAGEINCGTGLTASTNHLALELFKSRAGINIVRVPYKGSSQSMTALLANEVQMLFVNDVTVMSHVKAGKLRALAVTSLQPSALVPDLPTMSASGLPGFEIVSTIGVFAPAKTPQAIVNLLNREIVRVLQQPSVKTKYFEAGIQVVGDSSQEFANSIKTYMSTMGKLIKDLGIKGE